MCCLDVIAGPFLFLGGFVVFMILLGVLMLCVSVLVIVGFVQKFKQKNQKKDKPDEPTI